MATFMVRQVLPGSYDSAGISTTTTACNTSDPRKGQLYRPADLAAAVPVWFHPLPDGRYLGLFSRRLTDAVVADPQPGGPLLYSKATESTAPSWAVFDPATGTPSTVGAIPSRTTGDRILRAAVSRRDYLFVLSTIGDSALLQHFRVGTRQGMVLQAEEIVPSGLGLGLHVDRNDLWVFGATGGLLTAARKNWGRVGDNTATNAHYRWRYYTEKGWSTEIGDLTPMPGNVPAIGPVSIAARRDRMYLTVPVHTGTTWTAQGYSARPIDQKWVKHSFTAPLGTDATYLGGTAQLQPQLLLTPGYTTTVAGRGQTVLDEGSDTTQVFTGVANQVLVLPATADKNTAGKYPTYTLYNQSLGELIVQTATGATVTTVARGSALTVTAATDTPIDAQNWAIFAAPDKTPRRRDGFAYVSTVRLKTDTAGTLNTTWGALEV